VSAIDLLVRLRSRLNSAIDTSLDSSGLLYSTYLIVLLLLRPSQVIQVESSPPGRLSSPNLLDWQFTYSLY